MSAEAKPVDIPAAEPTTAAAVIPPVDVLPLTEPAAPQAKPVEETPAVAPVAAAAPVATEEAKTEETAPVAAATPVETAKKSEEKPVVPVSEGNLVYKAPAKFPKNLVPGREHKYFFYLGDAAVPTEKLSAFTGSVKADYTHEAAAWSSQTGKGLLYYSKTKDDKESPVGVIPLSDVTDIKEVGSTEFTFKIAEHKHVFLSTSATERNGWLAAIKAEVEAATGKKEEIHGSEGFKKALENMKPAVVAASVVPKKSSDAERTPRDEHLSTKDKAKSRSVSRGKGIFGRSGKKEVAKEETKKEEAEAAPVAAAAATEEPAVETIAPATAEETAVPAPTGTDTTLAAPIVAAAPLPVLPLNETTKTEEVAKAEEAAGAPKASRRSSKFGDFFKKVTSPTQEKKESDVVPAAAVVDGAETTKAADVEAPAVEAAAPSTLAATEAPETAVGVPAPEAAVVAPAAEGTTPGKEKKKFGLPNLFEKKAKSPSTDAAATDAAAPEVAVDAPAVTEGEAVKATEPVAAATEADAAKTTATPTEAKEKRRSSFFFGDLGGSLKKPAKKTDAAKESPAAEPVAATEPVAAAPATETSAVEETKPVTTEATETSKAEAAKKEKEDLKHKVAGLGRRLSTAIRGNKEKKTAATPAKVDESAEGTTSTGAPKLDEPKIDSAKLDEPALPAATATENPKVIGDVVPEAVNIGSAPAASPVVSATA